MQECRWTQPEREFFSQREVSISVILSDIGRETMAGSKNHSPGRVFQ